MGQTYYTTDGSTPTTSSSQGTTVTLTADGVYTIKYFSVDTVGNAETVKTAGTQIRIDTAAPVTTDNTASFGNWTNQNVTVTLTPTDAGPVAATYYTTNGTTPTTASTQGTSISLTAAGHVHDQVLLGGRGGQRRTGQDRRHADPHRQDGADDHGQHRGDRQRLEDHGADRDAHARPTPVGRESAATYYTTNGTTPTTASAQGTSILLDATGTYTIRYFSVDAAGNTETVKTAGTQIRIDLDGADEHDHVPGERWVLQLLQHLERRLLARTGSAAPRPTPTPASPATG